LVPQWDLLDVLADAGQGEPTFTLRMQTAITALLHDGDTVTGVRCQALDGSGGLRAELTVGCDGAYLNRTSCSGTGLPRGLSRNASTSRGFDSNATSK
jgi:hypothetical protein